MTPKRTLTELDFSDLLIEQNGCYLKNLAGAPKALTPVEDDLQTDVDRIKTALESRESSVKEFALTHDKITYRVSKTETIQGILYVMRKGRPEIPDIGSLGLPSYLINKLLSPSRKNGLILIAGQMGSGKTLTACSFLKAWLEKYGGHAIALEDPPELPLQEQCVENGRCYQIDISNRRMANEIVNTLRRAADLIFLGELRDEDAISESLRASINGHLILATIHAAGIRDALQKMSIMGSKLDGPATLPTLSRGIEAVIYQELDPIRKRLSVRFLFAEGVRSSEAQGIRAMIREGNIDQLGRVIDSQKTQMRNDGILKRRAEK